ncbi:MAG: alpha-2-macroglobulin family protein, partial [Verrucomicrobiota bacterium]|nr:alpha-2-macroglobulin family protein [Verrucomicrobiota bacterium]
YLKPKIINIKGKSTVAEIKVTQKDMPNFFLEAFTISGGKIYEDTREVIVPPQKRILNVEVLPSETRYKPGAPAKVKVRLTDLEGEPFVGSTVVTVYDKALEYISGGSNVPEIKEFFWKWRRNHNRNTEFNLNRWFRNVYLKGKKGMNNIGAFGDSVADDPFASEKLLEQSAFLRGRGEAAFGTLSARDGKARRMMSKSAAFNSAAPVADMALAESADDAFADAGGGGLAGGIAEGASSSESSVVQPVVRSNFADLAFWASQLNTDKNGIAEVEIDMPENLTTWKIKTWAMGQGTKVGHGEAEVITSKDLLIRMQAPRFFVEKDEVTLSANVHNYLKNDKDVKVEINLEGNSLEVMKDEKASKTITIKAGGEQRVDWLVKAIREGEASITMKALTDEESDAMQMSYPVLVHGMLKTESFSGALNPNQKSGVIKLKVPAERRPEQTRLEVRYSPSLATAMVDALPYLVDYPYGCTEQTLNRFIPTVITQKILLNMGIDLKDVKKKRTNLNAQEIGKDKKRAKQWKRGDNNPVFDDKKVEKMVKSGVERLTSMQNSDGGWGWFYGPQERSWAHTTAVVVHGLQLAVENDIALVPGTLNKGVKWLELYQNNQVRLIKNAEDKEKNKKWKNKADNLDAFVFMVLCDAGKVNAEMGDFLYRDRNDLSIYSKSMLGLAMHKINRVEERDMLIQNVEQFLVIDDENQSAYLDLRNGGYWWYWYGSEFEAQAYYLKLLSAVKPDSPQASGLAKYLINNRKNATYWNSTRDTAICIEALADYIKATGENEPELEVEVVLNGKVLKEVKINKKNLFNFDNKLVLEGDAVDTGDHKLELRKKGKGPLYFNAYLTNFTLEDFITKAGLEVKVNRSYFKLLPEDKSIKNVGSRGQSVDQKIEKFKKIRMASGDEIKSGD